MKYFAVALLAVLISAIFYFLNYLDFGSAVRVPETKYKTEYTYVKIGDREFKLAIADTEVERQKGLSGRDKLPEDEGMIFLFDAPGRYQFWMKDMKFPLDIIWLKDGEIIYIVENAEPASGPNPPVYKPNESANEVIEVQAGSVRKLNLKIGDHAE